MRSEKRMSENESPFETKIRDLFVREGLELLGFIKLSGDVKSFSNFRQWLSEGKHADMGYMENYQEIRQDPSLLEVGLRHSIIFGMPYYQGDRYQNGSCGGGQVPRIAQYARMKDYHKSMKKKAIAIFDDLHSIFGVKGRVTIDTAPILERDLAVRASFGFIGKNTCFIEPRKGSFFLLGAIHFKEWKELSILEEIKRDEIADLKKDFDPAKRSKELGGCGTCRRCQVFCPTGALDEDYVLDANKCLSYWTIEHRGLIPKWLWKGIGQYWYGCDICQLVCPYNRKIAISKAPLRKSIVNIDLFEVATMSQHYYEETFGGTPMTRAKKSGLQRNALIAMFSRGDSRLGRAIEVLQSNSPLPEVIQGTINSILEG